MPDQAFAIALLVAGPLLVGSGLLHRQAYCAAKDRAAFLCLYRRLRGWVAFFRTVWMLGTTPVAILLLALLFIPAWQTGLAAVAIYLASSGVERAIKTSLQRPRPYEDLPDIEIGQPRQPVDASHPSGDAFRVWFFALMIPIAFSLPPISLLVTIVLALLVSLGRITLGVHYPLDVLAGSGLGIFAAGLFVWVFV
jgi:membrane-associated phospholipid phosphatase